MFGLNDSAIRDAEAMAEVAAGKQRDINERLAAITGAAKRPELARKEGIDVHNQQAVQARIEQLRTERDSWEHWHTDPDRVALVRREAGLTEQTHESSDVPNNDQNIEPVQDEHSGSLFVREDQPGLFAPATSREEVAAAARAKDDERNGRADTVRTDMAAGDGELFAGNRPEQAAIETTDLPAQDGATYGNTRPLLPEQERGRIASPQGAPSGRGAAPALRGQTDLFVTTRGGAQPDERSEPAVRVDRAKLGNSARLVQTGQFNSSISVVNSWHDAASIVAPLRKSPQEQMLALALDKNDRPIAVVRHTLGTVNESLVEPSSILGALAAVPGVRAVYFAHNHPSGRHEFSEEDRNITKALSGLLEGSGIAVRGMIVVTPGGKASFMHGDAFLHGSGEQPTPQRRSGAVPQVERVLRKVAGPATISLADPDVAKAYIERNTRSGDSGVVLLDIHHGLIGQLPFEPSQAVRLRTGDPSTGYASLIRQVAEANATAAIVFGPPSAGEALRNVATALAQTRVRVLDLFKVENGQAISTRKTGGRMTNDTFFQRGSALPAEDGAPQERLPFGGRSLDAVRAQVDHVTGSWKGAPAINLHESPEDLPQSLQAEAKAQGVPLNEIVAAWHDGEIHLVGSHPDLTTERQVEEAIWHEAVGHHGVRKVLGNDLRPFLIKLADDMGGVVGLLAEAKRQGIDLSDYEAATRDNPNVSRMDRVAILAEELAAHIAQKGPPALKQRLKEWLGAIKNWLRSHGFPRLSKLSDLDLANLLRRSRKAVKTGVDGKAEAGTTFSRAAVDEGEDRATEQARDTSLPVPTPPALPQSPRAPGESHAEWQTRLAATHAGALRRALHRIYNDPFNVPKTQAERDVRELGRQGFVGMLAHLDRSYGQAEAAVHDHKVRFDKMTEPERLASIDQWETGATVTDPMAAQFFAAIDSAFESRIAEIQRLKPGALTNLIQNYFPHIWVKPTKASIFYRGKAPLEGDKSFLKKRTWPTLKQGIASGLEPVTTNPAELAMMKLAQMDKFIGMLDYRNALNARGWVHRQPAGDHIPPGWAPVKDPAFTGENRFIVEGEDGQKAVVQHVNYLVPEPLANDINNYLSRGLRDVPGWRQLRFVQNLLMAGRLGWSGFHAGFTTMDNLVLHADTAARRLMMGDFENGLIDLLKAPLSIVTAPYYGGQLKQSWFGTRSSDPHTAALLDLLEKGGARAHMDPSEWNGGLAKAIAAARQHSAGGVAKNALGAVTDASGWLIHRKLVPAQKMSARVLLLKFELDRFAKKYRKLGKDEGDYAGIIDAMTPDAAAQIARKVVNLIDDRLGQMAYDNQFWNQYVRHAAQVAVGAPGWQVGTVRTVTGAVTDTAKMLSGPEKIIGPLDKAGTITDGTFGRLTGRQSYLLTLAMVSVAITSTLQYLLTGHGPDEPKDVFFPKTGRSNPDGTAERVSLPSYWKEHYALAHNPLQTAMHKIHPLFGGLWELGHNQDFYGTQIRDEDAPLGKQALQVGEYIAKAFAPYVVAGNAKLDKTDAGIGAKVGNFFGVTPAPASVSRTPFQEYLAKRGAAHASQGGRTQEQADRSNARNEAIDATRAGKNPDLSQFTEPDRKRIAADSQLVQPQVRFQRLSLGEKLHAWNMATPQERDDYDLSSLILKSDWQKYIDAQPETDRQDLLDQLQAVKDTPVANYSDRLLRSEDGSLEAPRETPSGPSPATVYAQHAQAQKLRDAEVAVRDAFTQRGEDAAYAELERHRDVLGGDVIIEVTYSGGKDHLAIHGLKERKQELLDRIK